jgi:hypothetical protein
LRETKKVGEERIFKKFEKRIVVGVVPKNKAK